MTDTRKLSKYRIVRELGEALTQRLVLGCIRDLQKLKDCLLSGDSTPLDSIWDEICVQQQRELSFSWKAYLETISGCIEWRMESLASHELDALWLLTPEGDDWNSELEGERETYPVYRSDVADFLQSKILDMANDWTNARIRRYLWSRYHE